MKVYLDEPRRRIGGLAKLTPRDDDLAELLERFVASELALNKLATFQFRRLKLGNSSENGLERT